MAAAATPPKVPGTEVRWLPADVRFHNLRRTAATLMLANGVDIPTVAAILGHSRNSTTLDVYAHVVPANTGPTSAM